MCVSKAFLVLCLLLMTLRARASDFVMMRDGSVRSGTLELCADDQCRLSGKRIPVKDIRAIFLDGQRKIIPGRSNAIVMRDGSVKAGRVTFVSRGTVETDNEEIDRSRVAAIIFEGAADKPVSDLLMLRDGTEKNGRLTTCSAVSCTLDGAMTPLADIEWVGLAREDAIPPSSAAGDEVHKTDGSIAAGRLSRIDAGTVSTTRGRIPRAETAWIHVAAPTPAQPNQPGSFGAPQPDPPPPQPPVQEPQPPRPAPQPPGTGSTPSAQPSSPQGRRAAALWTGIILARMHGTVDGTYTEFNITGRVRMREKTNPLVIGTGTAAREAGSYSRLVPEGTVLSNSMRCRGKVSCDGEGTVTTSGEDVASCSSIWLKTREVDTTAQWGFDAPRAGMYTICLAAPGSARWTVTYGNSGGSSTSDHEYISPVIGSHPGVPAGPFQDPLIRRFDNGPGKMQGTYSIPAVGAFLKMDVSWSICREGVQCSDPSPLPGTGVGPDPGGRTADAKDEDDCLTLGRLIDGMRALREAYEAFEASFVEAERNRDQARDSIYGFQGSLAQFFTSLGSLASEALIGTYGDVVGLIGAAIALGQDPGDDNLAQGIIALADADVGFSPAAHEGVLNAIRKADAALEATDLDSIALRTYAEELAKSEAALAKGQKIVKGISVVVSVKDYYDKTKGLADSIQSYLDHRSEAERNRSSMNEIQDQMEQKQAEIDEARAALDEPCPDIPSTGNVPRRNSATEFSSPYRLVQSAAGAGDPPVTPEEVRTATAALSRVEARMASATTWLMPFFARVTEGVSPRMLRLLLKQAEPDLRAVKADLETAGQAGRDLEQKLRQNSASTAAE